MSARQIPEDESPEPMAPADAPQAYTRIDISGRTLARIVIAALLTLAAIWLITSLGEVLVMIPLAVLIAVVLSVFVNWLERKGVKRGLAALLSLVGVLLVVGGVLAITIPPLVTEFSEFLANLPSTAEGLRARLSGSPEVYNAIVNAVERLRRNPAELLSGALEFGFNVASVIFAGVLLLTLALYFLIDADRVRAVVMRLTPREYRARVEASSRKCEKLLRASAASSPIRPTASEVASRRENACGRSIAEDRRSHTARNCSSRSRALRALRRRRAITVATSSVPASAIGTGLRCTVSPTREALLFT